MQRKKTAVIIGGGISGVTAAEELIKQGYTVKILEKEPRLGGKIYSPRELATKSGVPELGAMVMTSNYPAVDAVVKYHIAVQPVLPCEVAPINQVIYGKSTPSFCDQATYAMKLMWQNIQFSRQVWSYNAAIHHLASSPPKGQSDSFDQFCKKLGLDSIARFEKIWVPGMGYGDLKHNPAYRIIYYMGYSTIPTLALGTTSLTPYLFTVPNGYQSIVEKIAEHMDVETSVHITCIKRNPKKGVTVYYTNEQAEDVHIDADYVVLTMSPYYWPDLNMQLTPTEQRCIRELKRVPYSTAVVDIEGYGGKQLFVPEALNAKGFGHIGFISTKGEGRCVVYINRDPTDDKFSLAEGAPGRQTMLDDLKKLGYDKVNILKTQDWPDYNATIPWELGMTLEKEQGKNGTLYVGSFRPTSFESVAAAEESARATILRFLHIEKSYYETMRKQTVRALQFFFKLPTMEIKPALVDTNKEQPLPPSVDLKSGW